ncbi:GNAT family N-acetyltransferase [Streptomyces xiamenensis]|uniref:GNAT family N-acetyltransferase n=1 Tax=Streptomyces xiamenensis TaxID=408015 RepID=UPI0035E14914
MIIAPATPSDLPLLLNFRKEAAAWLGRRGIDQWTNPFPEDHILASIKAESVFLVMDGDTPAGTVTLDAEPEPGLWSDAELKEPSLHLHKLIVSRAYAGRGLGSQILCWASDRTAQAGGQWLRINAWTTNADLHAYWAAQGFRHVRTVSGGGVGGAGVAGWLAQRPASPCSHDLSERIPNP